MAHAALGPICGRESLEKFARRTGGGKVANRQWKAREQQLALLRTAMLCTTMRLQVCGTQRYANNDALARGTGGGKVASRPKSHGEWCLKLRLGEHHKTLPHATRRVLPGTPRPYVLGRCCPEAQGAPTVMRGCAPQWRREAPQGA